MAKEIRTMFRWTRTLLIGSLLALAVSGVGQSRARADKINSNDSAYAIGGYDPVAYFEEGKPVRGKPELGYGYRGARWLFSSDARRQKFVKNPSAFAPQYDGY